MGRRVKILCTVGTSLVGSNKNKNGSNTYNIKAELNKPDNIFLEFVLGVPSRPEDKEKRAKANELSKLPSTTRLEELNFDEYNFPTAEIQTIARWVKDNLSKSNIESLHLVLYPSQDEKSLITARATRVYLQAIKHLYPGMEFSCEICQKKIEVDDRKCFIQSVAELFKAFDEQQKNTSEQIIICASGGYKAIAGFAMMYAQIHGMPCLYTFESAPQAFEVMSIPLGYAYASLDEEINMLNALAENPDLNSNAFPQWVQDSKELAPELVESYKRVRKKPYGIGEALFGRLRSYGNEGASWAEYLSDLLVQNWSELWIGDQIPETVEHSRRHSKRLMEFASNLFRCAESQLERLGFNKDHPELLALLIASIYLHDIGHTALSFPFAPERGFPLGMFPSSVREIHNLLTGSLLRHEPERYLGDSAQLKGEYREKSVFLKTFVPYLAEHHRGYTKLMENDGKAVAKPLVQKVGCLVYGDNVFENTLEPLEKRLRMDSSVHCDKEELRLILNAAALLRIIDGCDVQADRVVSEEHLKARERRTEDEACFLEAQIKASVDILPKELHKTLEALKDSSDMNKSMNKRCNQIYNAVFDILKGLKVRYEDWGVVQQKDLPLFTVLSFANRIAFKREQFLHFSKHQSVGFVLPVMDKEEKNLVNVQIYTNDRKDNAILTDIENDINGEYDKVKSVLEREICFKAHKV